MSVHMCYFMLKEKFCSELWLGVLSQFEFALYLMTESDSIVH